MLVTHSLFVSQGIFVQLEWSVVKWDKILKHGHLLKLLGGSGVHFGVCGDTFVATMIVALRLKKAKYMREALATEID